MSVQAKRSVSSAPSGKRSEVSDLMPRGREWTTKEMEDAMMEALVNNRVQVVDGLLQRGCSMEKFLTIKRMEDLYNAHKVAPISVFQILMKRLVKKSNHSRFTLKDVGLLMQKLIGGSYVSPYTRHDFGTAEDKCKKTIFPRPFNDLQVWAVLTTRREMAMYFWQRGEDTVAKCLVAVKLYKACSEKISDSDSEEAAALADNAKEFERLSVEVLNHCYQTDDDKTLQLLTYELKGWPDQTCLGLAVAAENRPFLAHPCCQILLAHLWHGGMKISKQDLWRVLLTLLCPLLAFRLIQFKSKGELVLLARGGDRKAAAAGLSIVARTQANTQELTAWEKLTEFLSAPITTFWIWTLSYMVFLGVFTYAILVATPEDGPSIPEYFVISYAFTYSLEAFRRVLISEPRKCSQKLSEFFRDLWQLASFLATVLLATGFGLRFYYVSAARVIYACDIAYWYLRLLELIEVSSVIGPYLVIIAKMLSSTIYMVAILFVILWSFGVLRQSILYPNHETWNWMILRNVTYKTYFMWYGEVYAEEIDECGDKATCVPGSWIATFACALYLLLTNIILINLLIAMFNHIYTETSAVSTQVWKFRRHRLVMEYEQHPCLPPPLVILYHIYALLKCIGRCCRKCSRHPPPPAEFALKLFLNDQDIENLLDFEEDCMEDMAVQKELNQYYSHNERLRRITERQEFMSKQFDDALKQHDTTLGGLTDLINKLKPIEHLVNPRAKNASGSPSFADTLSLGPRYPLESAKAEDAKTPQRRMSAGPSTSR